MRTFLKPLLSTIFVALLLCSCQKKNEADVTNIEDQNIKIDTFFDSVFNANLEKSPETLTYRGDTKYNNQWDNYSYDAYSQAILDKKNALKKAEQFKGKPLSKDRALSLDLFIYESTIDLEGEKFHNYQYIFNQMYGAQSNAASFLIGFHQINSSKDAKDYIERISKIPTMLDQQIANAIINEKEGFMLPKFLYSKVLSDCDNLLKGAPLTETEELHPLAKDFYKKIEVLEIPSVEKDALKNSFDQAMINEFAPSYKKLILALKEQEAKATNDAGVWRLKDGKEYYEYCLKKITSTDLTADQIHQIGLHEVGRIHREMESIMKKVGFKGNLQEFFVFMEKGKQFYYPNTDKGKEQYLADATAIIDSMRNQLDELFITKPKAPIKVKRVEAFREKTAGKAFYNSPAKDGSRPGYYYANLYNTNEMPKYEMEALAYHEGIPGHHMQIALTQELEKLPEFRKDANYTAYIEGWGLYAEYIPKELGFYSDPYSDFGRLAMELWRSCRLVVDTGIHDKKWTREEGISYYVNNTPAAYSQCEKMVDRHIVMPGQATAYKVGLMKILELKEKSKIEIGHYFDIREFHEAVLCNGPLPMSILEKLIDEYIRTYPAL